MKTFTESVVNDTIETNASFMQEAGLKETVTRNGGAKCCEWCEKLEGTWEYGKQPKDFFRQHENCTCVITFRSEKGKRKWNGQKGKKQIQLPVREEVRERGSALEKIVTSQNNAEIKVKSTETDIRKQSDANLRKGIRTLQEKIKEHENKIKEPEKYCEQWQSLSEKHKEGIIKHWEKEKKNFEESIKNRVNEMERRSKQ